jgi:hypothetical protein
MRYCGRQFTDFELSTIRGFISGDPELSRYRLSKAVCESLNWRKPGGGLKDMSCRVALLKMEADGLIKLPLPKISKISSKECPEVELLTAPPESPPSVEFDRLSVQIVHRRLYRETRIWNAYIRRYHYLGHNLIPGAQLRYLIRSGDDVVALASFGASAWKTRPRDDFIGWTSDQREKNLHLIVNNSRFLILPWIRCNNLASKVLSTISRRLPEDWHERYDYSPVLLETFVDKRFRGTCYRAANWQHLGETQGRGKLDSHYMYPTTTKGIWVYPLKQNFRRYLCG